MLHDMNVAVRFIAYDLMTPSMMKMAASMKLFERNASLVETRLKRMRSLMLGGAGAMTIGFFGAEGIAKLISPANQYVHLLNQANAMGIKHQEIAEGVQKAWETTAKVQTVSVNEAMKMWLDLRYVLGSTTEATKHLVDVARMKTVFTIASEHGISGKGTVDATEMSYSAAKAIEMLGKTRTPEEFKRNLDAIARVMIGTAGRVTGLDYQTFAKYARQAGFGLDENFLYGVLPTLIQEQKSIGGGAGGARGGPGAALAATYRFLVQGIIGKKVLEGWKDLGLTTASGATQGQVRSLSALEAQFASSARRNQPFVLPRGAMSHAGLATLSPIVGASLVAEDPYAWEKQYLIPAIKKKYGNVSDERMAMLISHYFKGNQYLAQMMTNLYVRRYVVEKDIANLAKVKSVPEILALGSKDPYVAQASIMAQWETARTALGQNFVITILPHLIKIADWLNQLAQFFMRHPTLASDMIRLSFALSVMLGVGGLVTLLTALINPIGAVAGALVLLAWGIKQIKDSIKDLGWKGWLKKSFDFLPHTEMTLPKGFYRDSFGELIYDPSNPLASKGFSPIKTGAAATTPAATGHVYLDGRKVGSIISDYIGNAMSDRANIGASLYNVSTAVPVTAHPLR